MYIHALDVFYKGQYNPYNWPAQLRSVWTTVTSASIADSGHIAILGRHSRTGVFIAIHFTAHLKDPCGPAFENCWFSGRSQRHWRSQGSKLMFFSFSRLSLITIGYFLSSKRFSEWQDFNKTGIAISGKLNVKAFVQSKFVKAEYILFLQTSIAKYLKNFKMNHPYGIGYLCWVTVM